MQSNVRTVVLEVRKQCKDVLHHIQKKKNTLVCSCGRWNENFPRKNWWTETWDLYMNIA